MKITITDISESDLGTQIAIMNVDNPTKITKIKQGNGLWTIIGEFPDDSDTIDNVPMVDEISPTSVFAMKFASIAQDQHTKFHLLVESNPILCKQIEKYWTDLNFGFSSCTTVPWSAVFVSWCVKQAGATSSEFKFSPRHSEFVHQAIQNAINNTGVFQGYDITTHAPNVGDIVQNNRGDNSCDFAFARTNKQYDSHSAIVVEIGQDATSRFAVTIGGNEGQSIVMETVPLTSQGFIKQRVNKPFISIIKNLK